MANPTTKRNSFLDPQGFRKLLKPPPSRAIADNREASQITPQKGSSRAQRQITGFAGDKPTDKNQLKLCPGLRTARVTETQGPSDSGFRDKKQFVAIHNKLSIGL